MCFVFIKVAGSRPETLQKLDFLTGKLDTLQNRYFEESLEAVVQRCSVKKVLLKKFAKFTGKLLCQTLLV